MQVPQLRTRLDSQLFDEGFACGAVGVQRIRLAAAAIEREHPLCVQALAQRVGGDQRFELDKCLDRVTVAQVGFDGDLERAHPQLVEPPDLGRGERLIRDVGERRPTPQSQRRTHVTVRAAEHPCETLGVDGVWLDPQLVGATARNDRGLPEQLAQLRDVQLDHLRRTCRRMLTPEAIGQAHPR